MDSSNFFKAKDGIKLFYQIWTPSEPKAVIIIIHGAGEHSGRYRPVCEQCMKQNIAVVAPDLRGFGQSEGLRGHINTFQEYVDDLHALIEWVSVRFAFLPIFLFGHSLGGLIVIRYSQIYDYETKGVILSAPALALRLNIPSIGKRVLEISSRFLPTLSINSRKWQPIVRRVRQLAPYLPKEKTLHYDPHMTTEITPKWLTELLQNGINALTEAALFRYPVLCVYDEKDPVIQPVIIEDFLEKLDVLDKKWLSFNDGFHHILHADYHQTTISDILHWINHRL